MQIPIADIVFKKSVWIEVPKKICKVSKEGVGGFSLKYTCNCNKNMNDFLYA